MTISFGKALHVPKLERNLLSEHHASLMSRMLSVKTPRLHTWELERMCAAISVARHRRVCMR